MDFTSEPHRCPKCHALVVDRRSTVCTTCRVALPADWIMTPQQKAKLTALNQEIKAEHVASLNTLDPRNDPNTPPIVRFLDTTWGMGI